MSTFDAKSLRDKDDNDVNFTPTHYFDGNTKKSIAEEIGKKYEKPSNGIPKSDLSSSVQSSLGKADSAVQPSDLQNPDYGRITSAPMGTAVLPNQTSTNKITQTDINRLYFDFLIPNNTCVKAENLFVILKLYDMYRKNYSGDHPVAYSIRGTFESVTIFANDGRIGNTGNGTNLGTFTFEQDPNEITRHLPIKFFEWCTANANEITHFNIRLNMKQDMISYIHVGDDIDYSCKMACWNSDYPSFPST